MSSNRLAGAIMTIIIVTIFRLSPVFPALTDASERRTFLMAEFFGSSVLDVKIKENQPPGHQDAKFLKSNQQSFDYFGVVDLLSPIQVSSAFSPLIFNNE